MMKTLYLLTLLHLLVDGVCGAVLYIYAVQEPYMGSIVFYFGLYTIFAFGLQGPVGWVLDKLPRYLSRCLLLATLFLGLGTIPQLAIGVQAVLLGLGNCLFHVTGGSYVLRKYNTYTELGLFVCSGAIGLGLGLCGLITVWSLLILNCLVTLLAFFRMENLSQATVVPVVKVTVTAGQNSVKLFGVALLLLSCVMLRGFGSSGNTMFAYHMMVLQCTLALGKFLGGVVCDKWGYKKTVLIIFALGFVALQVRGVYAGLLFALACNMTMPLTLRLAHWCRVGAPGLMFGLAASCLMPGAIFQDLLHIPAQLILVLQFLTLVVAGCLLLPQEYRHVQL